MSPGRMDGVGIVAKARIRLFGAASGLADHKLLDSRDEGVENGRGPPPGETHSGAKMNAIAERELAGCVAGDVEIVGSLPSTLVAVRRGEQDQQAAAGRHLSYR